jgi:hypothetical protein
MRVSNVAISTLITAVTLTTKSSSFSIIPATTTAYNRKTIQILHATLENSSSSSATDTSINNNDKILSGIQEASTESQKWAEEFDLVSESCASFYALFSGIKSSAAFGLKGSPFYLKGEELSKIIMNHNEGGVGNPFQNYFTFDDLAKALEDDFLDANRGSTDNRQGWKVCYIDY